MRLLTFHPRPCGINLCVKNTAWSLLSTSTFPHPHPHPHPPPIYSTQMHLRHNANRQHIQHDTHTPARHHRPNEQIVRHRKAGTQLQDRIHPVGAREGAGRYAADDGGVAGFDFGGGVEEEELEARSGEWDGVG